MICGTFLIIFGALVIICSTFIIIFDAFTVICGPIVIICSTLIIFGAVVIFDVFIIIMQCFYHYMQCTRCCTVLVLPSSFGGGLRARICGLVWPAVMPCALKPQGSV